MWRTLRNNARAGRIFQATDGGRGASHLRGTQTLSTSLAARARAARKKFLGRGGHATRRERTYNTRRNFSRRQTEVGARPMCGERRETTSRAQRAEKIFLAFFSIFLKAPARVFLQWEPGLIFSRRFLIFSTIFFFSRHHAAPCAKKYRSDLRHNS